MTDPDADSSWMLDDDTTFDSQPAAEAVGSEVSVAAEQEAEVVKPPGEWRTTYKLDVSITYWTCTAYVRSVGSVDD